MSEQSEPIVDLRDWLRRVDAIGELKRIEQPIDPIEEMSAIVYLAAKRKPSPAILFDHASGSIGLRHLWNIFGSSLQRTALSLEEPPDTPAIELIRRTKEKLKRRIPPEEAPRSNAPVYENSLVGDEIDLTSLAIPRHWPLDGGLYAGTADAVITRDPDSGYLNIGTYRMMIQGPRRVGLSLTPGKDALAHIHRAWERGESLNVAAAWGIDPLLMMVGSQSFPRHVSEFEVAGGVKGKAIDTVRATCSDLLIPAAAELVVEGVIRPNAIRQEGPFGEFTGYYGKTDDNCSLVEVTAIHHRTRPILTNALMADYPSCEQSEFFAVLRSARVWNELDALGLPGIHGVYFHPAAASGFGLLVIGLQQKYAGHAAQALALAAQSPAGAYLTKWIVAVDDDVDPTDLNQVVWAMTTRSNPADDIDILRNTRGSPLDPTQNVAGKKPYGSKALINACIDHRYFTTFSKRTLLRRPIYDRVAAKWSELGFAGASPHIERFEPGGDLD